jgi:hypothetical protein
MQIPTVHCITSRNDSRILKWNAGVSIFLLQKRDVEE